MSSLSSTRQEEEEVKEIRIVQNNFTIIPTDKGNLTTKYDLSFKAHVWIVSKNHKDVEQYIKSLELTKEKDLNTVDKNPKFSTLLFFDFFKKVDSFSAVDVFRSLFLNIRSI